MWKIDKSFNFSYGHRVWTQELITEYSLDSQCQCRHLHGHEALVKVFLKGELNEQGMVTDFKHLNWLKLFLDTFLDHKFIIDINDPLFEKITDYKIVLQDSLFGLNLCDLAKNNKNNELHIKECTFREIFNINSYYFDTTSCKMSKLQNEFYDGFFMVNFVPTSENLAKWLYSIIKFHMRKIDIDVSKVEWNETPKSRAVYTEE